MKNNTVQLNIKSININSFKIYNFFLQKTLNKLNIKYSIIYLPIKQKRITLLKAPHVYKKAREQFEIKTFNSCIQIKNKIKQPIFEWLLLNKPSLVQIKITYK